MTFLTRSQHPLSTANLSLEGYAIAQTSDQKAVIQTEAKAPYAPPQTEVNSLVLAVIVGAGATLGAFRIFSTKWGDNWLINQKDQTTFALKEKEAELQASEKQKEIIYELLNTFVKETLSSSKNSQELYAALILSISKLTESIDRLVIHVDKNTNEIDVLKAQIAEIHHLISDRKL